MIDMPATQELLCSAVHMLQHQLKGVLTVRILQVVLACLIAAFGGLLFGYDAGEQMLSLLYLFRR